MNSDNSDEDQTNGPANNFHSCKISTPKFQKPLSNPINIANSESMEIWRRISYPEGVDLQHHKVGDDRPVSEDEKVFRRKKEHSP
jgi:hypothetical protein